CAQCHDHKHDPVSQKEYFRLYAFFNNVAEFGIEEVRPGVSKKTPAKYPMMEVTEEDVKGILSFVNKPDTSVLRKMVLADVVKGSNRNSLLEDASRLMVSIMGDMDTLRQTYILERGDYQANGEEANPGTPNSILPFPENFPKNRLGLAEWLFQKD